MVPGGQEQSQLSQLRKAALLPPSQGEENRADLFLPVPPPPAPLGLRGRPSKGAHSEVPRAGCGAQDAGSWGLRDRIGARGPGQSCSVIIPEGL